MGGIQEVRTSLVRSAEEGIQRAESQPNVLRIKPAWINTCIITFVALVKIATSSSLCFFICTMG